MNGGSASTGARARGRLGWSAAMMLLGALGLASAWGGCDAKKNYELLSFFFDGVPDPNAKLGMAAEAASSPTFSQHQPFVNDDCLQCHEDPSRMEMDHANSSLCMNCHEGVLSEYPRIHGAVAAMACLRCHNPHFSALSNLLREPAPGLCLQCHDTGLMSSPTPPHEDLTRDCLECHVGHGGPDLHFLRADWTEKAPQTPTSESSGDDAP